METKNYEVIFFDAWKNDFTKDPLLAFFSEINENLDGYLVAYNQQNRPFLKNIFKSSLPILITVLTKHLTEMGIDELNELMEEEENKNNHLQIKNDTKNTLSSIMSKTTEIALKEHTSIKKSIKEFKENMQKILGLIKLSNKDLPLFILIDELDRCRPNYAIELLEGIKQIFDIPNIYFIIATNSKQLSHSINAIYGANFSSETYLKKFFDQEYVLKEPNRYEYCKYLYEKEIFNKKILFNPIEKNYYQEEDINVVLIETYSNYFNLSPRDIKQCIEVLGTINLVWDKEDFIHLAYLMFWIMLKHKSNDIFFKYKDNEDSIFIELKTSNIVKKFKSFAGFYSNKTSYGNIENIINKYTHLRQLKIKNNDFFEINLSTIKQKSQIYEFKKVNSHFENRKDIEVLKEYPNYVINATQLR